MTNLIERSKAIEAYMQRRMGGSEEVVAAIRALPAASVSDEMVERARQAWHDLTHPDSGWTVPDAMRAAIEAAIGHGK